MIPDACASGSDASTASVCGPTQRVTSAGRPFESVVHDEVDHTRMARRFEGASLVPDAFCEIVAGALDDDDPAVRVQLDRDGGRGVHQRTDSRPRRRMLELYEIN